MRACIVVFSLLVLTGQIITALGVTIHSMATSALTFVCVLYICVCIPLIDIYISVDKIYIYIYIYIMMHTFRF